MLDETPGFDRKVLYSVAEVAAITGCRPGRILRWIHRRQLDAVHLEGSPLVPLPALVARLERIEAARARRRALRETRERQRRLRLAAESETPAAV
ncbi:MAG: hypothetical protein H0V87_06300 [Chloroflexi bacterium]|nr:hypothetical protein [Chloroflexota bacterium]